MSKLVSTLSPELFVELETAPVDVRKQCMDSLMTFLGGAKQWGGWLLEDMYKEDLIDENTREYLQTVLDFEGRPSYPQHQETFERTLFSIMVAVALKFADKDDLAYISWLGNHFNDPDATFEKYKEQYKRIQAEEDVLKFDKEDLLEAAKEALGC